MRVAILSIVLAACSYDPTIGGGDDTPGEDTITIKHDTAAELDPLQLIDAIVSADGRIEPNAYVTGGLRARAFSGKHVDGSATFASLDAAIQNLSPVGRAYGQLPDDWTGLHPKNLSLTVNDDFTIYFDGEIFLRGGHHAISIDGDDAAIAEVTVDGANNFVLDATGGRHQTDFDITTDGWYPIRFAIGEGNGNAKLSVQDNGIELDGARVRSRVTDERGLIGHLYESGHTEILGTAGVDGLDGNYGQLPPPNDFPAPALGNYEWRVVGQVYLDVAGSWTFEVTPDDQDTARLWIDEVHIASSWSDDVEDGHPASATVDLAAGWHDIFLDLRVLQVFTDGSNRAHPVSIAVRATPPGGTAAPIPLDHLRPVVSSGLASSVVQVNKGITSDGTTTIPFSFPPAMTTIHSVDAGYSLANSTRADFTVELDAGGTLIPIPNATGLDNFGLLFDDVSQRGQPVPTVPWGIKFTDNVQFGNPGFAQVSFIDIVTRGGPAMPFSPLIEYTSKPIATPDAIRLGAVRITGSFDDTPIVVEVRTAATEAELEMATYVEVASGEVPDAVASEFIQYRIGAKSDGWQFPVIDIVELDYVVAE